MYDVLEALAYTRKMASFPLYLLCTSISLCSNCRTDLQKFSIRNIVSGVKQRGSMSALLPPHRHTPLHGTENRSHSTVLWCPVCLQCRARQSGHKVRTICPWPQGMQRAALKTNNNLNVRIQYAECRRKDVCEMIYISLCFFKTLPPTP